MRYADPRRCPDCGSPISPTDEACPACRLPLRGPTAAELFTTLTRADQLLLALRAPAWEAGARPTTGRPEPAPATTQWTTPPRTRLSGASAPRILLGLGALCLLVAALVFL